MVFLLVCFYTYTETIDAYIPKYDAYKQAEIIVLGEVMDSFVNDSICLFKKKRVFKGVIDDKIIALKYTYIKGRYLIQLKRIGSYDKFPLYKIEKFYDDIREVRFYTYVLRLKSKKRRIKRLYYAYLRAHGLKRKEYLEGMISEGLTKELIKSLLKGEKSNYLKSMIIKNTYSVDLEDDSVDSFLIKFLYNGDKGIKNSAIRALGWRKKQWTKRFIREKLFDKDCCEEAIEMLSMDKNFTVDSLLWLVKNLPYENGTKLAMEKIQYRVASGVYLKKHLQEFNQSLIDSFINILRPIEWTEELRSEIVQLINHPHLQTSFVAISTLGYSHDTTVSPVLKNKMDSLFQSERSNINIRKLIVLIHALGEINDKRNIPFLIEIIKSSLNDLKKNNKTRALIIQSIWSLQKLEALSAIIELKSTIENAGDEGLNGMVENAINRLK